jgi:hypothetical protein
MTWLHEHKRIWRTVVLALLLIAMIGPWAFELINVPAEYSCSAPYIRLKGDYCGTPVSVIGFLPVYAAEIINVIVNLVTGANPVSGLGRSFLFTLGVFFLFLPIISTLLLILPGNRRRQRIIHLVMWGLGLVSSLAWLRLAPGEWLPNRLWGPWLYIGLILCVLILEELLAGGKGASKKIETQVFG